MEIDRDVAASVPEVSSASISELSPASTGQEFNNYAANIADPRTRALMMQAELGSILTTVKSIKDSCAKLKSENKSLQEYIESLMAKR